MQVRADVRGYCHPTDEIHGIQPIQQEAGGEIVQKVSKTCLWFGDLRLAFDDIAQTESGQEHHAGSRHPLLKMWDIGQQCRPENGEEYENNITDKHAERDFDTRAIAIIDAVLDEGKENGPESKTQCNACQRAVK